MTWVIVGVGNPGKEYEHTRHNAGREAVELFAREMNAGEFVLHKIAKALVSKGAIEGEAVTLVLPETFVNLSGKAASAFIKTPKAAKSLVVVHDDLDLPLGTIKMVVGRGSGGHKGVESIMRAVKSKDFVRIRIGISAVGKKNQAKKVQGEEKVIKQVLGKWKPSEVLVIKKAMKKVVSALTLLVIDGVEAATQFANTR
jgi:PTH1 family peptidyl-tRNA hydrolase